MGTYVKRWSHRKRWGALKSEHLFLWNLRQFLLDNFKKPHDGKKTKEKDKANGVGPIKIDSLVYILWCPESYYAKNEIGQSDFHSDFFFLWFGLYFFSFLHWKLKNYMRCQKPLKRASKWDQSRCSSSIRLATALRRVPRGLKLGLQKKY